MAGTSPAMTKCPPSHGCNRAALSSAASRDGPAVTRLFELVKPLIGPSRAAMIGWDPFFARARDRRFDANRSVTSVRQLSQDF
jgi:hypothetical protein